MRVWWLLVAGALLLGCAARMEGSRDQCTELVVLNHSWDDVVVRSDLRRLRMVPAQTQDRVPVCGHQEMPVLVQVQSIGQRVNYVVRAQSVWGEAQSFTLVVENVPAHSLIRPTYWVEGW